MVQKIPDIDKVLTNSLKFKSKLAIGEDTYKSLKIKKNLSGLWGTFGIGSTAATIAKSSWIASAIGVKKGIAATLSFGLLGTVSTPLTYVAVAAIGSTAIYFGVMKVVKKYSSDRVTIIPKFINTPLDLLAVSMFDLIAPAAYKMSQIDGNVTEEESELIFEYFVKEWGYSAEYVNKSSELISDQILGKNIEEILSPLIDFIKENPDCNKDEIAADILLILREIAEADGILHENEKSYLDQAYKILSDKNISFEQVSSQISSITKKITKVSLPEVKLPKVNMPKMEMPNFLNRDKK